MPKDKPIRKPWREARKSPSRLPESIQNQIIEASAVGDLSAKVAPPACSFLRSWICIAGSNDAAVVRSGPAQHDLKSGAKWSNYANCRHSILAQVSAERTLTLQGAWCFGNDMPSRSIQQYY